MPDDEDHPLTYLAYVLFVLAVIVAMATTTIFLFVSNH